MKFFILTLFLLLSVSFTRRVKTFRKYGRYHSHLPKAYNNPLYQIMLGLLSELDGKATYIDECSQHVPGWEAAGKAEESSDTIKTATTKPQSKFEKILPYLGKGIDFICGYKDDIKKFLISAIKRYFRLFLQGKTRRNRFKWNPDSLWNSVQAKATKFGEDVLEGTTSMGSTIIGAINFVCKTIDQLKDFMKEQIKKVLEPITKLWEEMKAEFLAFLSNNPMIKQALLFIKCIYDNKAAIKVEGFIKPLKGFVARLKTLNTGEGWINLIVDAICNWSELKKAIKFLSKAWNSTSAAEKFNMFGKFVGKLIQTLQAEEPSKFLRRRR